MTLIDTHTHLYLEDFDDDRDEVVNNAITSDVTKMLLPNIDSNSIAAMKRLVKSYPDNFFPMMGLHPTSVKENFEAELAVVESELQKNRYYGVGEIGIDLYWDKTFKEQQQEAFRYQLMLAKKYGLPVSIHTRNSFDDIYVIVKDEFNEDLKGVFHCFTGNKKEASMIMDIGFLMGIGGIVTFKNSGLSEVLKYISNEYIVLETDSPFLTPVPYRGKRNQSAYLVHIAEKIASVKNIKPEEVAEITTENAITLFNLKN
jgi:TatD DNase family protein